MSLGIAGGRARRGVGMVVALAALIVLVGVHAPQAFAASPQLSVEIAGAGHVTGGGIDCTRSSTGAVSGTCSVPVPTTRVCDDSGLKPVCYTEYGDVTLTASPATGFSFHDWTDCDTTSGSDCDVTVSSNRTVTAVLPDITPPTVALTSPSPGPRAGVITLGANASDTDAVSHVDFLVGGVTRASDGTAPYSATFDTRTVADGTAAVVARAFDRSGNVADSATTTITVDNTPPSITLSGPDGSTFGPGSTQAWSFGVTDANPGDVACSVVPAGQPTALGACTSSSTEVVSGKPEGAYVLTVRSTDQAGNVRDVTRSFAIDATPPETSVTAGPADGAASTASGVTYGFASSEPGSSFACRLYAAGTTPPGFGSCSDAGSHTASGLAPGGYVFEVRATDAVGNADPTPAARRFTVLAPAPGGGGGGSPGAGGGNPGGGDTPAPGIALVVKARWYVAGATTRVKALTVSGVPAGGKLIVTCNGKGCPFARRTAKLRHGATALTAWLKAAKLRKGARLTLKATAPGRAARTVTFVVRAGRAPRRSS